MVQSGRKCRHNWFLFWENGSPICSSRDLIDLMSIQCQYTSDTANHMSLQNPARWMTIPGIRKQSSVNVKFKKNIKKKQPKNTYVNVNEIVHTINKSLNYDWTWSHHFIKNAICQNAIMINQARWFTLQFSRFHLVQTRFSIGDIGHFVTTI